MSAIRRNNQNKNGQRLSRFVFTLNNWTPEEYTALTTRMVQNVKWCVIGKEMGDNGTPHLQGAAVLLKQTAFTTVKSFAGMTRAHIENMRGTPADSLVYCTKEDKAPFVHGSLPEPGKRNDLHDACAAIMTGTTMRELALEFGPTVVKFSRGLATYKSLITPPRDASEEPTVYWLYGETGSGKTKCAWEFATSLYGDSVWTSHDALQWFDGYDGQQCVIVDDFRAKNVSFSFFLRVLDRYPLMVPVKGNYVSWTPKVIIITSPHDIDATFAKRLEHIPEDIKQLKRRVTGRFYFPDDSKTFLGLLRTTESSSLSSDSSDSECPSGHDSEPSSNLDDGSDLGDGSESMESI